MRHDFDTSRLDRVSLLDEHLYDAYRRAQRSTEMEEQVRIESEIRMMQRERTALLEDILSVSGQKLLRYL